MYFEKNIYGETRCWLSDVLKKQNDVPEVLTFSLSYHLMLYWDYTAHVQIIVALHICTKKAEQSMTTTPGQNLHSPTVNVERLKWFESCNHKRFKWIL